MASLMENNLAYTMHPGNKEFGQGKIHFFENYSRYKVLVMHSK